MHNKKIKIIALGLISTLALVGCSVSAEDVNENTIIETTVQRGDIREEITLSGTLEASKLTTVSAGENSIVEEIYVSSNEDVVEGEDIILLENGNVVEAPYDGKISKITISEGDTISTTTGVFNIVDDSGFEINTSIDESDITKVSVGQEVEINVSAIDKDLVGIVESIDAEVNSGSFGVTIVLQGDGDDTTEDDYEGVYTGMSSELNIVISESTDILLVPVQAVQSSRGVSTVNVKNGEETVSVEVEIGAQDSSFVEIVSGLNEGDTVVYEQVATSSGVMGGMSLPAGMENMDIDQMKQIKEQMGGGQRNPQQ